MEAMEKSGFSNFKPDIDSLLMNIEKEAGSAAQNKKRKMEDNNNVNDGSALMENEKEKKMDIEEDNKI